MCECLVHLLERIRAGLFLPVLRHALGHRTGARLKNSAWLCSIVRASCTTFSPIGASRSTELRRRLESFMLKADGTIDRRHLRSAYLNGLRRAGESGPTK